MFYIYLIRLKWEVIWIIRRHCRRRRHRCWRRLLIGRLLICWLWGLLITTLWGLLIATLCRVILATTEELHLVGNNLNGIVLSTILLPLTATDTTFDIYLRALTNILIRNLGKTTPQSNSVPLGILRSLVCLTIEDTLGGCKTQTRHLNASLKRTHLRILTYIT